MNSRRSTPGSLRGLVAAVLMAVVVPSTGITQTTTATLSAKLVLRAMNGDERTAYKLPATVQSSGGLSTIGIGQPAYLEILVDKNIPASEVQVEWTLDSRPDESMADLSASPLGDIPTYQPADREDYRVAGRTLLLPDTGGVYNVKVTVSTAKNGSATKYQMITAGTYVGVSKCVGCHNGGALKPWSMVGSWAATGHANIFKQGMNGVASSHYGAGCLSCHTVGYDAASKANNGGFDDVAAQLKWTFPTPKAGVYDTVPEQLKALGGIQCENCHGPGSRHISSGGDSRLISVSRDSGVCSVCHSALTHHVKSAEWNNSRHAVTTRAAAGAGHEGCVGCHTGTGFIDRMNGNPARTEYSAINCQACHESHGQVTPNGTKHLVRNAETVTLRDGTVIQGAGTGTLCMNCHQSRQNAEVYAANNAASARFGPHHSPQADMLRGANGFSYGKMIPSSAHIAVVEDTCAGCHMQPVESPEPALTHAGGHTFKPGGEEEQLVAACQNCHGKSLSSFNFALLDYDNDGKIEGVQTEVQHLLDELSALLPPAGKPKASLEITANWTRPQLKAAYNWQFVAYDGSKGVHNMAYAIGLLKASIADLKENK